MRRSSVSGSFSVLVAVAAFAFATVASEHRAEACGASPGGPMGHIMCGPDDAPLEHRFRGSLGYSFANTRMSFGDGLKFTMNRHLAMATLDYRLDRKKAITFGAGGLLLGNLRNGQNHLMSSGPALLVGYSAGFLKEEGAIPFGVLTLAGSFVHASTRVENGFDGSPSGYTAFDFRFGMMFGKTLFEYVTVYAKGTLFGGPAFWSIDRSSALGTDLYHYQVGGGLIVKLPAGLALYGEGIALGERGFVAGLSLTP